MTRKHGAEDLDVVGTSWNFMVDTPVPWPGVPGAAVPRRVSAWVADRHRKAIIGLVIDVSDRERILELNVQTDPDSPATPSDLREMPLGAYVDAVLAHVMLKATRVPGTQATRLEPLPGYDGELLVAKAKGARRRGERRAVDLARLDQVAQLYREALAAGVSTSRHIAEKEHVSDGTARSLVAQARKAGVLGPALGRRAGEGSV